jgi:hypothetical protein
VVFNRLRRGERSCESWARSVFAGRQRLNTGGPVEFLTAVTGRLSEMHQPSNALSRVCSNSLADHESVGESLVKGLGLTQHERG